MLNIQLRLLIYLYKCKGEENTFSLPSWVQWWGGGWGAGFTEKKWKLKARVRSMGVYIILTKGDKNVEKRINRKRVGWASEEKGSKLWEGDEEI